LYRTLFFVTFADQTAKKKSAEPDGLSLADFGLLEESRGIAGHLAS
jgi:hypothetical protein